MIFDRSVSAWATLHTRSFRTVEQQAVEDVVEFLEEWRTSPTVKVSYSYLRRDENNIEFRTNT